MEAMNTAPSVRVMQKELLKLKELGLVVPEGKARAVVWVLVK